MLLQWPFQQADEEGVICYLDTALNGPGRSLYERNGFVEVDKCELDLKPFGGDYVHTHVGMIREPKGRTWTRFQAPVVELTFDVSQDD